jgi:DNA-binding transcriptional regulator YhcF (GntR family)
MVLNNMKKLVITPQGEQLLDLTNADITQREQDAIQAEQDRIAREQELAQQESKKQSAIAKLKALGLDEEEIKSLLGV